MSTLPRNDDGLRRATASQDAGRTPALASLAVATAAAAAATTDSGRSSAADGLKGDGTAVRIQPGADDADRPTLSELVDRVIDHFDADADGAISADELAIAVDASGRFGDLVSRLASHGLLVDSNADGLITADELAGALADDNPHLLTDSLGRPRLGPDAPAREGGNGDTHDTAGTGSTDTREPVTIAEAASTLFGTADTNADATLSLAEVMSLFDTQPTTIAFDALVSDAFGKIDTDADQRLTLQEVTTAIAGIDGNGDGLLSGHELGPHPFDQLSVELIGLLVHKFSDIDCTGG